jgi:hypothetical protein
MEQNAIAKPAVSNENSAAQSIAIEAAELVEGFVSCSTALMSQVISASSEATRWREATKAALNIVKRSGTDLQKQELAKLIKQAAEYDWVEQARQAWKTQPLSADFTRLLMQKQVALSRWKVPSGSTRPMSPLRKESSSSSSSSSSAPAVGSEHVRSLKFFDHLNQDIAASERANPSPSVQRLNHTKIVQQAGFVPSTPSPNNGFPESETSEMTLKFSSPPASNSERTKIQNALDEATARSKAALMKGREASRGAMEKVRFIILFQ